MEQGVLTLIQVPVSPSIQGCINSNTGGVLTVIHNKNNYKINYKNIYKIISFYL